MNGKTNKKQVALAASGNRLLKNVFISPGYYYSFHLRYCFAAAPSNRYFL